VGVSSEMIVHGVGPSSVDASASRSDERCQPVWVTLADSGFDSAKIGPRDIIPPLRRGGDLAQQSWHRKLVYLVSVGRTGVFTKRKFCVQSSVPVRTARAG
jgi:hypothetical protein